MEIVDFAPHTCPMKDNDSKKDLKKIKTERHQRLLSAIRWRTEYYEETVYKIEWQEQIAKT